MPDRPTPAASSRALATPAAFFAGVRPLFGGSLGTSQLAGIQAKLNAFGAVAAPIAWTAYGLATSAWETAMAMTPVSEAGCGRGLPYGVPGCHAGQVAYGRGDVQLTWDRNYERADRELGLGGALIADYALALRPDISAQIMVRGMVEGWFTGKRFADYLPVVGFASSAQFTAARRIINGVDRAAQVASYAAVFQEALADGHWSAVAGAAAAPAPATPPKA